MLISLSLLSLLPNIQAFSSMLISRSLLSLLPDVQPSQFIQLVPFFVAENLPYC